MARFPSKSTAVVAWRSAGSLQKTLARCVEKSGNALHSGKLMSVKLWPEIAGTGRYFQVSSDDIPAVIDRVEHSPLCTTLCGNNGSKVRTVEHLLSALEATGVDNCRIEIDSVSNPDDGDVEVPILDGSAREWVEVIGQAGLENAVDQKGNSCEKMVPYICKPVYVKRNDSYLAAFPSSDTCITYGIDFSQVREIGLQWFSISPVNKPLYISEIASARTFCIYEEVEAMRNAGLIKGGSLDNALVCSVSKGWLNPSLRFEKEPCRHKVLDLIGDLSVFARGGSQGIPVGYYVAYKAGHALHADLVRSLSKESCC